MQPCLCLLRTQTYFQTAWFGWENRSFILTLRPGRQCGFFILFPGFWQVKVLQVRDIHSHHPILESIIIKKYFGFGCPLCCLFLLLVYLSTQIFCQPILLLLKIFFYAFMVQPGTIQRLMV